MLDLVAAAPAALGGKGCLHALSQPPISASRAPEGGGTVALDGGEVLGLSGGRGQRAGLGASDGKNVVGRERNQGHLDKSLNRRTKKGLTQGLNTR